MTTIQNTKDLIANGSKSAVEMVEDALNRLEDCNKTYNVGVSTMRERAMSRAKEIDERLKKGEDAGRLAGVPFMVKDNFLTLGGETTAASNILKGFKAPYQSTAIERLEAEGAICIAKANLDAFGHGSSTENSDFGPTKNPHDISKVPGGSSGGSGAAVALDIVPFTLGTDTGGSIRLPASFCGVVGLKPTYGLVSRYGVVAMSSSTDTIGPMTHTVEDTALVLDIIAGQDVRDGTTLPERQTSYVNTELKGKLNIGIIREHMAEGVDEAVRNKVNAVIEKLRKQGHDVSEVSIPSLHYSLPVYYVVIPAEISSNLARYDGIRYGQTSKEAKTLHEVYGLTRDQGFNAENERRILVGTYVLSSGYYDAYYRKAQLVRTAIIRDFEKAFTDYDILIGPVAPTTAFKLGENDKDPLKMYLSDMMTVAANLVGLPAISVPAGKIDGMPCGVQLMAPSRKDHMLLQVAAAIEDSNG